jgi:hypothetical protein
MRMCDKEIGREANDKVYRYVYYYEARARKVAIN